VRVRGGVIFVAARRAQISRPAGVAAHALRSSGVASRADARLRRARGSQQRPGKEGTMPVTKTRISRLPLRARTVVTADGDVTRTELVACPRRAGATTVADCERCLEFGGTVAEPTAAVRCHAPEAARPARPPVPIRLPSPAELTDLAEIMATDVVCIPPDFPVESAAALMLERSIAALPVVEPSGRAVGFVSKTDLVRWYHDDADYAELPAREADPPPDLAIDPALGIRTVRTTTAGEIMTALAFTLTEDAPIAYAAALMAVEGIHHVVITTARGEVTGMVSSLDVVTWLAHHAGFLVPKYAAKD
jgi:CBS domain-containing protein